MVILYRSRIPSSSSSPLGLCPLPSLFSFLFFPFFPFKKVGSLITDIEQLTVIFLINLYPPTLSLSYTTYIYTWTAPILSTNEAFNSRSLL
ncbi:hypothetical protein FPV67DRAFT_1527473 [Lyophyllum atratum]|nr:hypothetical protein FPV67DRAFT_1527473 [Lyophyllum atratum]